MFRHGANRTGSGLRADFPGRPGPWPARATVRPPRSSTTPLCPMAALVSPRMPRPATRHPAIIGRDAHQDDRPRRITGRPGMVRIRQPQPILLRDRHPDLFDAYREHFVDGFEHRRYNVRTGHVRPTSPEGEEAFLGTWRRMKVGGPRRPPADARSVPGPARREAPRRRQLEPPRRGHGPRQAAAGAVLPRSVRRADHASRRLRPRLPRRA